MELGKLEWNEIWRTTSNGSVTSRRDLEADVRIAGMFVKSAAGRWDIVAIGRMATRVIHEQS